MHKRVLSTNLISRNVSPSTRIYATNLNQLALLKMILKKKTSKVMHTTEQVRDLDPKVDFERSSNFKQKP